ncbi:MAG: HAD-IA family hydrolase [Candidatus Aenigmarchaeota archaeon]|nr:HAD-IA family hydrolase [Candidatus Aenigmarchaeota archaeon]
MKKIIIFDLGGVLVADGVYPMIKHLTEEFSLDRREVRKFVIKEFNHMFEGRHTELDFWKRFDEKFGVKTDPKLLEKRLNNYYSIKKDTKKLVTKLRNNGYNVGFLSNSVKEIVAYLEKKYRISKIFGFGIYSHTVKTRKPGKKIFRLLLKRISAKPDEIIFIDDNPLYVKGSRSVGIKTIRFISVRQTVKALGKLGVAV